MTASRQRGADEALASSALHRAGCMRSALVISCALTLLSCAALVANLKKDIGGAVGIIRCARSQDGGKSSLPRKWGPESLDDDAQLRQRLPKISAIYPVWYETDMMLPVIQAVAPFVSELVVVDGPRRATIPLMASMGLMYTADDSPVKRVLDNIIKPAFPHISVKYHYQVWDDEKGQRNFGFNACSHSIMIQVEGDMIMQLNAHALEAFVRDQWHDVSGIRVSNMVRSNLSMVASVGAEPLPFFPLIAKRNRLSADEYFNHLWIVGNAQGPRNQSQVAPEPIGYGYHLTLVRSLSAMASKYAFYRALQPVEPMHDLLPDITASYGQDVAREVFVRSMPVSAFGLPFDLVHSIAPQMWKLHETAHKFDRLLDYAHLSFADDDDDDDAHGGAAAKLPISNDIPAWALLPHDLVDNTKHLCFSLQQKSGVAASGGACGVSVIDYYLNARPVRQDAAAAGSIRVSSSSDACVSLPSPDATQVQLYRGIGLQCTINQADANGLRFAFLSIRIRAGQPAIRPS